MNEPECNLRQEILNLAETARREGLGSKVYKMLNEYGLNFTELYIKPNKVYTEEDRKRLMLLKIKHEL
jgi:hypothetical protein